MKDILLRIFECAELINRKILFNTYLPESKIMEFCDFDSVDMLEFLMELEVEFSIEIQDEEFIKCKTFEDLVKLIENKLSLKEKEEDDVQ